MQSLDSRQEADLIINNTLLKLKGSSNNNSTFRHTAATTQLPHVSPQQRLHQQQYNHLEFQQQSSQTHLSSFPQQYQTTLLSPILNSSTGASSSSLEYTHQTPTYVFDGVDSLSEYTNISEQDLFATVDGCQPETHSSSNLSTFTNEISPSTLLSNINSITSPSPVVPDKILSTPSSASSSSPPTTSNYIKTEKFPQISDNVTATANNLYYNSALSSSPVSSNSPNSKKRKLSPVTNFNDTLQSLLSDGIIQTNFNSSTTNSCMQTVSNTHTTNTVSVKTESFSVGDELQQFHQQKSSINLNYLQSPSTATNITNSTKPTSESTSTLNNNSKQQSTLLSNRLLTTTSSGANNISKSSHSGESAENPSTTTAAAASTGGTSSNFFDIHDKIKQLYNLLIRDEKSFKEIRRRHRTRSFVLERLVERERLNKIVLNLYSGNQGYSLAVYQDTRNPNEPLRNENQCGDGNNSSNATGGTSSTSSLSALLTTGDNFNSSGINGNASSSNNNSGGHNDVVNKDGNLIEIGRWDYEMDDLLSCIDKEELPVLFLDLLESSRIPNVFYSGCVICQVRDFRQTFLISSKSCDIYHVLLKPTNDSLYSDVNRIALKSDISSEDKLLLESQLVLATSEPLCLDPDPTIGRYAINSQHKRQIWNTPLMRRQMKKYSRNSINRKRKIVQFTHNYGLDIYDYLQKNHRSKINLEKKTINAMDCDTINSNNNNEKKLPELKNPKDVIKPISAPNLNYPPLILPKLEKINPLENYLKKYAPLENYLQKYNALENYLEKIKALENYFQKYEKPKYAENKDKTKGQEKTSQNLTELKEPIILFDCGPQLTEEYILETGRECGRIYHIKLSIFQRPATFQYLGELYVDRDYKEGQRNGEACKFSLGTISHAKRYIEQFRDIFTEEGRKSVTIIHNVPGKEPEIEHTGEHTDHVTKQSDLALTFQQPQQQQQQQQQPQLIQQHNTQSRISTITQTAQQQIQIQQAAPQLISPTINTANSGNFAGNPLNINLQGANILGITTSGNIQQIRQRPQQMFDTTLGTRVSVQTAQPTQQLSLSNGSLVLVQQQPSGATIPAGLAIQTASSSNGQQKTQVITNANQLAANNATIRTQLGSVPFLEAQLKAAPLTVTGQHRIIQRKTPTTIHSTNPTFNAIVNGLMNTANQFQQQQQQQSTTVQQQITPKSSSDATILSILNSTPAAMTAPSAIVANTFNAQHGQQATTIVQQSNVTADSLIQQSQQQQLQRKQGEIVQNIFAGNLRKINMISGNGNATALGSSRTNTTNLIAVSAVGLNQDQVQQTQAQNVQVTMSALASQLASPPAVMTNTNFGYTTAVTNNSGNNSSNNNLTLNNTNSIKILNSGGQRVITATTNAVRRDSTIGTTAVPSPGSDSNASNTSSHSNLGFTMPGLSALLTASPSPNSDQVQAIHNAINNGSSSIGSTLGTPTLIERLNSGTNISTSPGLSPHQQQQSQQQMNIVAKAVVQQHNTNVQSPANSISPLSSPPPQSSPQNANMQQQQSAQPTATTLNLSGINFSNLQGAVATISNLQNVQVQIPGLPHPISLQLSGSSLAAAVQQQQQAAADGGGQQMNTQPTSLLVSVPVTSTTQVNTIQSAVPGIANCGNVVSVPATATGTQTVVLTNSSAGGNSSGSVLSLPVAQLVPSGVKNINAQALRTTTTIPSGGNTANIVNANLIQTASGNNANLNTVSTGTALTGTISLNNSTVGGQPIQLLGTLQQRHRGIVVGTKQLANRVQLEQQRNLSTSTLKVAAPGSNSSQTANLTANPLVMSTQKVQFKLQKQPTNVQPQHQQQQIVLQHQQQQQLQIQQQNMQLSGGIPASAIAIANQNQKRRRSATDLNK